MSGYRKNAVVIDFGVLPTRPKIDKVRDFVFNQMCLDITKIKSLQTKMTNGQVLIETDSAELAEQLISEHHLKHSLNVDGKSFLIPVHSIDNTREVRIYDLPPQMPNKMIATHFSTYGQVTSIKDETWKEHFPGVLTGTRILRMKLRKHIPSYVEVAGENSYVSYKGQIRTCKHCVRPLHIGKSCTEARSESNGGVNKRITLAEVVQSTSPPIIEPTTDPIDQSPLAEIPPRQLQIDNDNDEEMSAGNDQLAQETETRPIAGAGAEDTGSKISAEIKQLPGSSGMTLLDQLNKEQSSPTPFLGFSTPSSAASTEQTDRSESSTKRPGSPNLEGSGNNNRRSRHNSK